VAAVAKGPQVAQPVPHATKAVEPVAPSNPQPGKAAEQVDKAAVAELAVHVAQFATPHLARVVDTAVNVTYPGPAIAQLGVPVLAS